MEKDKVKIGKHGRIFFASWRLGGRFQKSRFAQGMTVFPAKPQRSKETPLRKFFFSAYLHC
jgi:hypothetical protein